MKVLFSRLFAQVVKYCYDYGSLIPLSFVLGFYVSVVMARWWNQYVSIPFPDSLAVFVSATVHGQVLICRFLFLFFKFKLHLNLLQYK